MGTTMNAAKMNKIAEQARQAAKVQEELKKQEGILTSKAWWRSDGYPDLLRYIKQTALGGKNSYSGLYSYECPGFVLANLRCMGFEVTTGLKHRGPRKSSLQVLRVDW